MTTSTTKWLYLGLFISLAINLFVMGYFWGYPHKSDLLNTMPLASEIKGVYKNLPPENKKQIVELIKNQQQEIISNYKEIQKLRLQISQVLAQEPLNQQALGTLFEQLSVFSSKNTALAEQTLYQTFILLPFKERIKIAKAMAANVSASPKIVLQGKAL